VAELPGDVEPFCAFCFSFGSSDEVASTRRWSSSRPIRPSVRLKLQTSAIKRRLLCIAYPAKTPPARTSTALIVKWYQNWEEPLVAPLLLLLGRRYREAMAALTSKATRASPFLLGVMYWKLSAQGRCFTAHDEATRFLSSLSIDHVFIQLGGLSSRTKPAYVVSGGVGSQLTEWRKSRSDIFAWVILACYTSASLRGIDKSGILKVRLEWLFRIITQVVLKNPNSCPGPIADNRNLNPSIRNIA